MTLKFASHSYHIVKRLALIWIFLRFTRVQSSDVVYRARIVATFVRNRALSYSYDYVAPAVRLATEKARINYPDIDFELALREGSPTCETTNAAALAAEEYYLRNITAFVGPGCSQSLDQVARMASHWNIPVYTASGVDDSFTDKTIYPTLTRLSFSMDRVSDFFRTIFEEFHWRHVTLLVDESDPQNRLAGSSLEHTFKKNTNYEYFIDTLSFTDTENHPANLTAVLRRASLGSRVMVILASGEMLQRILLRGFELGMGAGDYAFLNIEMIRDAKSNSHLVWRETGGLLFYNQKLRKMYESLMVVSIRVPTSSLYSKFVKDMVEATRDTDFPIEEDSVSPLLSAYHDAVLLYAWALNRTLSLKEDPRDGQRLARRAWNNTFLGGTIPKIGPNVFKRL